MKPRGVALRALLALLVLHSCFARDMHQHQAPGKAPGTQTSGSLNPDAAAAGAGAAAAGGSHAAIITVNASASAISVAAAALNSTAAAYVPAPAAPVHNSTTANATNSSRSGVSLNGTAFIPGACGPKPSRLGYQCSWAGPDGVVLHWSYNVSHPPINRCTRNGAVPNAEVQDTGGEPVIHVALQAASPEKLHLVFNDPAGRLFPSEGFHGRAVPCGRGQSDCGSSQPDVQVLHYTSPGQFTTTGRRVAAAVPAAAPDSSSSHQLQQQMEGWAAWVSAHHDGLTGVICGSRQAHSKLMKTGAMAGEELVVTFAVNDKPAYTTRASRLGMAMINLRTGQATQAPMPTGLLRAHGILMLLAFGVLLPLGLLASRHKWFFVDDEFGDLSPWWGIIHLGLLASAAGAAVAGMIVVLVIVGNSGSGAHQVLGFVSIGLSLMLVVAYGLRPLLKPAAPGAGHPLIVPLKTAGWLTVLAGWTSLFLGCVVMQQAWAVPLSSWLVPCILLCSLVAALAVLAELRLQALIRAGSYNPRTCTRSNAGPHLPSSFPICHPVCHVRTGRQAFLDEPKSLLQKLEVSAHALIKSGLAAAARSSSGSGSGGGGGLPRVGQRVGQLQREEGLGSGLGGSRGGGGSHPGTPGSMDLHYRGGRQSTPNAQQAAAVVTGFPSSFAASEHC